MDAPLKRVSVRFNRPRPMEVCSTRSNVVVTNNNSDINYDALFEILMRVDPCSIFNCILVSNDWLSVITNPLFRKDYLNKWDKSSTTNFGIVGLLLHDMVSIDKKRTHSGDQMLSTSHLGQNINVRNLMPPSRVGFFISKSPNGSQLLFGGQRPKRWYVGNCKPGNGNPPPAQLPAPPAYYKYCMANIISSDDEDFKVILATRNDDQSEDTNLRIQIFCSKTGRWEQSTLTCSTRFRLDPYSRADTGTMTRKGVIYWRAMANCHICLAVWDINGGRGISILEPPAVPLPFKDFHATCGVSQPHGSLLYATRSVHKYDSDHHWESESFTINIWGLDNGKNWNLLHSVRQASIWTNNLALLTSLFPAKRPWEGFVFVSCMPGKSDSVLVALREHLFAYHFDTGRLEYIMYGFGFPHEFTDWNAYHPLTMLDLGVWPSAPSSLRLPCVDELKKC